MATLPPLTAWLTSPLTASLTLWPSSWHSLPPPSVVPAVAGLYLFFLGPGQAWWKGNTSGTPRLFARVALSTLWTGLASLSLAALQAFSIPTLALINACVTLSGYLLVGRARDEGLRSVVGPGFGLAVFALGLAIYCPPYETHIFASDSSSYTATGIHLSKAKRFGKSDPLLSELGPLAKRHMFPSVVSLPWRGPYARMPGGMVIESLQDDTVRPSFFPLPSTWAAIFAGLTGWRSAGAFAPVFAALALWAMWYLVRRRVGVMLSLIALTVAALNAASYWAGRFPLSEPLAWFYMMTGFVALDAHEDDGMPADAFLAACAFGGVVLCRIEYGLFLGLALTARWLLGPTLGVRRLPLRFLWVFCAFVGVALAMAALLPGAYVAPLEDRLTGLRFLAARAWDGSPILVAGVLAVAAAGVVRISSRHGLRGSVRLVAAATILGTITVYCLMASHFELLRSIGWLAAYLGWPLLLLAVFGTVVAWRQRFIRPQDGFFILVFLITAGLLIYDPHVMQVMPWASRRFVPLVIPGVILLAAVGIQAVGKRSIIAAAIVCAILVVTALGPARRIWGQPFFAGNFESLLEFNENLPDDGVLLIDKELSSTVLGTPLWLLFERNSLPVQLSPSRYLMFVAGLARQQSKKGPVYLLTRTEDLNARYRKIPLVRQTKVFDYTFRTLLPEQTMADPPRLLEPYTTRVSVMRLDPVAFPSRSKPGPGETNRPPASSKQN